MNTIKLTRLSLEDKLTQQQDDKVKFPKLGEDGSEQTEDTDTAPLKKKPPAKLPGPKLIESEFFKPAELNAEFINMKEHDIFRLVAEKDRKGKKTLQLAAAEREQKKKRKDLVPVNGRRNSRSREEAKNFMNRDVGLPDTPEEFINKPSEETTQISITD